MSRSLLLRQVMPLTWKGRYRRARSQLGRVWRRTQGDLELVLPSQGPDRRRLKSLRNCQAGRTAFLIGNGPSVRVSDLDRLRSYVTFCCNRFYLAYDRTAFRPTYLCSADPLMIRDFGVEMIARAESSLVLLSVERPNLSGDYQWVEIDSERPFSFTRNPLKPLHPGGGTVIAALQLGYWMGIRRFVLYGVDHSFSKQKLNILDSDGKSELATGEGNHFIAGYRSGKPWVAPWTETIEEAFRTCDGVLRTEGGWLINATRTTQLPHIERVSFDEALRRASSNS